jgi:hypothetical protein
MYHVECERTGRRQSLTSVSFTNCCFLGDDVVNALVQYSGASSLESVVFYKWYMPLLLLIVSFTFFASPLITDTSMQRLATCGRLRSCDVRGCVLIGAAGVLSLLRSVKALETLFVPDKSLSVEERVILRKQCRNVRLTLSAQ